MFKLLRNLTVNDSGATAVEYALMAALIAAVIFVAVAALGLTVQDTFQDPDLDNALTGS
jgi:pilus assembly protein Flp/PilA